MAFPIGALSNLVGPDVLLVLGLEIAVVIGIIWLVVFLVRRKPSNSATISLEVRLQKLDALRSAGAISNQEYEEQRRRILTGI